MKSGVLIVNKAAGMTSHDVVGKVRRLFDTKKVGHTGTLDPNATGVLPVLIGNAVKAADLLPETDKVYRAEALFGVSTDTEDVWGKTTATSPVRPSRAAFEAACAALTGEIRQVPPMVSAVKVNGRKLIDYYRAGVEIPRAERVVRVDRVEILSFTGAEAALRVRCSKGTYIRTLIADLAKKCGALAVMKSLVREESCGFTLAQAVTLDELEKAPVADRSALVIPAETLFSALPACPLPPFFDKLIANGLAVEQRKLGLCLPAGTRARLYRDGAFFALGESVSEDGLLKLKKIKDFPPDAAD